MTDPTFLSADEWQFTNDRIHWGVDVVQLLEQDERLRRQAWPDEDGLQAVLHGAFEAAGVESWREYSIDKQSRLDLFIPTQTVPAKPLFRPQGIAVEVKIKGSASDALRQLTRYAASDQVLDLVLVTTQAGHLVMPKTIAYKPLYVFPLLEGGL